MKLKSVEDYRRLVASDIVNIKSFSKAWPIWEPEILKLTSNLTDSERVFGLGDHLSSIFQLTSEPGREQSHLGSAGAAWEALNCWYLNLVFSGSRGIAIKQKKSHVPQCISDSASINYGSHQTNTESDIVVIVFPPDFSFGSSGLSMAELSKLIGGSLNKFEVGIIQCKTNWNDNAQTPMLWGMIYKQALSSAGDVGVGGMSIGRNGHSIRDLQKFTYSFSTVPSQKKEILPNSMPVNRVGNLSGGNYWGQPDKQGVAMSLKNIFGKNFKSAFDCPIPQSISAAIHDQSGVFGMK